MKNASELQLTTAQLKALVEGLAERDKTAPTVVDSKGRPLPDTELRATENIPLSRDVDDYVAAEIAPHIPEFWVDRSKDKVGYEIPFTRHFYKYAAPRELEEIDSELDVLVAEIQSLLRTIESRS